MDRAAMEWGRSQVCADYLKCPSWVWRVSVRAIRDRRHYIVPRIGEFPDPIAEAIAEPKPWTRGGAPASLGRWRPLAIELRDAGGAIGCVTDALNRDMRARLRRKRRAARRRRR